MPMNLGKEVIRGRILHIAFQSLCPLLLFSIMGSIKISPKIFLSEMSPTASLWNFDQNVTAIYNSSLAPPLILTC